MSNPWKNAVARVARDCSGIERMMLTAAVKHVVTEEGFRVALAAAGHEADSAYIEHLREIEKRDAEREAEKRAVLCPTCGKRASFLSAGERLQPGSAVIAVPGYYCTDLGCTHGWTIPPSSQGGP